MLALWLIALTWGQPDSPRALLAAAAKVGNTQQILELIGTDSDLEANSRVLGTFTPLMITARWGHAESTRQLLTVGADPNLGNGVVSPLVLASMHGHYDVVRVLLRSGADPNAVGFTSLSPLGEAVSAGHAGIIKELLVAGANPIADVAVLRMQPLVLAAFQGRRNILELLLHSDIDVSGPVVTAAFINAAWRGHEDIVEYLLSRGVDPNVKDAFGRSALDAARGAHQDSVRKVLERAGARQRGKSNALISASWRGEASIVEALAQAGADVNVKDAEGVTPLIAAVRGGNDILVIRTLLANAADVNAADDQGMTALMWAARAGRTDCLAVLLESGADPALRDHAGMTAIDFARRSGRTAAFNLLGIWRMP